MIKNAAILVIAGALAWAAMPATAQTSMPSTQPAAPAADDLSLDEALKVLDETMSREEIENLVKTANVNRLKSERKLVAADIGGQFYDPDEADTAIALLEKDVKNTQQDNIERICQAYACVDPKFQNLYKLYKAGKFAEAAAAGKTLVSTQSTYLSAAKAFIYAASLEGAKMDEEAGIAYEDVLMSMYDRISFGCEAAIRAAAVYERMGRNIYAMQMYAFMLKNYGLTMEEKEFDAIYAKVKKLQEIYGDPLGTVAKMMADVKERLAVSDSGKPTLDKQGEIVALLDDLIKTAEDKENAKPPPSQNKSKKSKPGEGEGKGEGKGEGEGKGQGQGKGKGKGKTDKPMGGAEESALREFDTTRAGKLSDIHDKSERGDWSALPPEQQQRLEQLQQRMLSERYRDIISDYHKRVSEEK